MAYTPRLTVTGIYLSKYYYSDNPFHASDYGLPNCTCYAWGRFYEISDVYPTHLPLGNGGEWFPAVLSTGAYQVGQTPKLGAVACYRSTTGGDGHVCIVEQINSDGSFVVSQSGYYRPIADYPPNTTKYFSIDTCDPVTKVGYGMGNLAFQGFIYNPYADSTVAIEWIAKNAFLTETEMQNNAILVYRYFTRKGWTLEAIAAMMGNLEKESTINPGIWEDLQADYNKYYEQHGRMPGYGLVGWTPFTKYSEWAGEGWENNGDKQCERIQWEVDTGRQWFRNPEAPIVEPPITFKEFTTSKLDVETLANYFLWYYEHPAVAIQPDRAVLAVKWYDYLSGINPEYPGGGTQTKKRKKIMFNSKWAVYASIRRRNGLWL